MQITQQHIETYQALYLKDHGKPISNEKALTEITALVNLLSTVHRYMERANWPDVMG